MLVSELVAKHLLILCCYGGSPFVDIQLPGDSKIKHKSTYALDPTDWIAVDTAGMNTYSNAIILNTYEICSSNSVNQIE
uniref:F5/8 type C domain-containing protein n=1 Tax=Ascaris lumbricoides TaxID=6252 RepID=A0A0M3HFH9_ASCLU